MRQGGFDDFAAQELMQTVPVLVVSDERDAKGPVAGLLYRLNRAPYGPTSSNYPLKMTRARGLHALLLTP